MKKISYFSKVRQHFNNLWDFFQQIRMQITAIQSFMEVFIKINFICSKNKKVLVIKLTKCMLCFIYLILDCSHNRPNSIKQKQTGKICPSKAVLCDIIMRKTLRNVINHLRLNRMCLFVLLFLHPQKERNFCMSG